MISADYTGVHAIEKLAFHANFAARILDPDPLTVFYAQPGGGIRVDLYQRIRVLLSYGRYLKIFGVKIPPKAGARN